MKTYRATELKQSIGEVLIAAAQAPIYISKHQVPRYVLMTVEAYQTINAELVESRKCGSAHGENGDQRLAEGAKTKEFVTA